MIVAKDTSNRYVKKFELFRWKVDSLGQTSIPVNLYMCVEPTKSIQDSPFPYNTKTLRSFSGGSNVYHWISANFQTEIIRFIPCWRRTHWLIKIIQARINKKSFYIECRSCIILRSCTSRSAAVRIWLEHIPVDKFWVLCCYRGNG